MKVLVSACLLGENCKYNGGNNESERVKAFLSDKEAVTVCPEVAAGLGVPRAPVEIVNGNVQRKDGSSVDGALRRVCTEIAEKWRGKVDRAILKSRSPTCGVRQVYDGTFSGRLVEGMGVLAQALKEAGIEVIDSEEV